LLKGIKNVPDNFFRYRERFVLFPAKIRFAALNASKECDFYYFFGTFLEVKENAKEIPSDQERIASELPAGCGEGSFLYDEIFIVTAKNSDKVEVRSSPDAKSAVSSYLQNGNEVLNLRTVNNDWLYIRAVPGDDPNSKEAAPVFGYIHKPSLKMEPLN